MSEKHKLGLLGGENEVITDALAFQIQNQVLAFKKLAVDEAIPDILMRNVAPLPSGQWKLEAERLAAEVKSVCLSSACRWSSSANGFTEFRWTP
jgi:hypothetical protein